MSMWKTMCPALVIDGRHEREELLEAESSFQDTAEGRLGWFRTQDLFSAFSCTLR